MAPHFLSLFRGTIQALIDALGELAGNPVTRLRAPHGAGATTLLVESVTGFQPSGSLYVGNLSAPITYTAVVQIPAGQRFTGCSPLTKAQAEGTEVSDATHMFSTLGRAWRALTVAYADGEDLSRVGRMMGRMRPMGLSDTIWRRLLQVLPYVPASTIDACEMVLHAVWPGGGWYVYEDLVTHPCEVFFEMPGALGSSPTGRTFMSERETVFTVNPNDLTVSHPPTTVKAILVPPWENTCNMSSLPDESSPPWTYHAEAAGAEPLYFTTVAGQLNHEAIAGDSGRFDLAVPHLSNRVDYPGRVFNSFEIAWRFASSAAIVGHPWHLWIEDGEYQYSLLWDNTHLHLGQADETIRAGPVVWTPGIVWHSMRIVRDGNTVKGYVDGVLQLSEDVSAFSPSVNKLLDFGFVKNAGGNVWVVRWDNMRWYTVGDYNYWNLRRVDGVLPGATDLLQSAAALFVAGDVDKAVRLVDPVAGGSSADGLWRIIARNAANEVQLEGAPHAEAYALAANPIRLYSKDPVWTQYDVGKTIRIPGGLNAGDHVITSFINPWQVFCGASTFVTEDPITWRFVANFAGQVNIPWEIIEAGTLAADLITARDNFPTSPLSMEAEYTLPASAVLLTDEATPKGNASPYYLIGTDEWLQDMLKNEVLAAGIIPRFIRVY